MNQEQEKLPRLQIPADSDTRRMLQAYADATGASLPHVCADILAQTAPVMAEMAQTIQQARTAPARAMRDMNTLLAMKMADADQYKLDLGAQEVTKTKKKG